MRVVLDTNVLVAAFTAHGLCNEVLEHCAINHEIVLSGFILAEFRKVLGNKFGFTCADVTDAVRLLESRSLVVEPVAPAKAICRDPDDEQVLGTALAGNCECIVTGDKDLLSLKQCRGIGIVTPAEFWRFEEGWLSGLPRRGIPQGNTPRGRQHRSCHVVPRR